MLPCGCCWVPGGCRCWSISCQHGAQQQTCCSGVLWANDGMDRQMDGWRRESFIDPALHTMRAVPVSEGIGTVTAKSWREPHVGLLLIPYLFFLYPYPFYPICHPFFYSFPLSLKSSQVVWGRAISSPLRPVCGLPLMFTVHGRHKFWHAVDDVHLPTIIELDSRNTLCCKSYSNPELKFARFVAFYKYFEA